MIHDLTSMDPAEKDRMLLEFMRKEENDANLPADPEREVAVSMDEKPSGDQDMPELQAFADVLDILICKMEELENLAHSTDRLVREELFGGIQKMYDQNMHRKSVDGIRGKYGAMFSEFEPGLKELAPGEDLYEELHNLIDEIKGDDDMWDDEKELDVINQAKESIAQKISAFKPPEPEIDAVEIEVIADEEPAESKEDAFLKKVKSMKAAQKK